MNPTLINKLENKWTGALWYEDFSDERFKLEEDLYKSFENSDFAVVYTTEGKKLITAKHNFNGGTCGCCSGFSRFGDVSKVEFYKL